MLAQRFNTKMQPDLDVERFLLFGMTCKASDFLSGLVEKKSTLSAFDKGKYRKVSAAQRISFQGSFFSSVQVSLSPHKESTFGHPTFEK